MSLGFKKKILLVITCVALAQLVFPWLVFGETEGITTRADWHADDSLITNKTYQYSQVKAIQIEDFTTSDDTITYSTQTYLQGLYTYLAKQYNEDLPYAYIVGWDGSIYEGSGAGVGATIRSDDPGSLLIGYFDDGSGITTLASTAFAYLLPMLNQRTGIGLDNMNASGYTYSDGVFSTVPATSSWSGQINLLKKSLTSVPAKTTEITYSVKIGTIQNKTAQDGNTLVIVAITNSGSSTIAGRIYAGSDTPSPLAVTNEWVSNQRSNVTNLPPLQQGKSTTISFEIPSNIPKGIYPLSLYTDSTKIAGSDFSVNVATDNAAPTFSTITPTPTQKQITIISTPTGTLNVRSIPSLSGTIVSKVSVGQSFTVLDSTTTAGDTWYKISYDGKNTGWIDGVYTKN